MINRRFMIVPPALPRRGHAELLGGPSEEYSRLRLETANMRVPRIVEAQHNLPVITGLDPVICRGMCGDRWLGQAQP